MRRPRTVEAVERLLRSGWLMLGEAELWEASALGGLYRAAERVIRTGRSTGLPGTLRALACAA